MRLFIVLFIVILAAGVSKGQTSATRQSDGSWNISMSIDTGKDLDAKAVKTACGTIKSKDTSSVTMDGTTLTSTYTKSTKTYTLTCGTTELLVTKTVAMVRATAIAYFYKELTGRPLQ